MVPHDGLRSSAIHHPARYIDRAHLSRTAIDEVTNENSLPAGVAPCAGGVLVFELGQESFQLVGVPVDVADDVVVQNIFSKDSLYLLTMMMSINRFDYLIE